MINTKSQAVAATAVGVSWLTAGIMTGGLVVAGTMVAAGVTVGSMGGEKNLPYAVCSASMAAPVVASVLLPAFRPILSSLNEDGVGTT